MGLPAPSRCPQATVRRHPAGLQVRFRGPDGEQAFDVDARVLGAGADLEHEELVLLAELGRRGYEVRRLEPDEGDGEGVDEGEEA